MNDTTEKPRRKVEHHHVFITIFLCISLIFAGNIIAINLVHKRITASTDAASAQQTITISKGQKTVTEPVITDSANKLSPLSKVIVKATNAYPVDFGIVVQNLKTGDRIGVNDKLSFKSASIYKLFVGYEVMRKVDKGELRLSDAHGGTTIQECMRVMIVVSDNNCGRSLRNLIGAANQPMQDLIEVGFVDTNLTGDYPVTTARDVAFLYEDLYSQRHLLKSTNDVYLKMLKNQQVNNRIPQALPSGTKIAHKTGDLEGYSHDTGIIYTKFGDFSIVILSGQWPNGYSDAPPAIVDVTKQIYDWLDKNY